MRTSTKTRWLAALLALLTIATLANGADYTITDLGTLSGQGYYGSEAYGINDSGEIVGNALYNGGTRIGGLAAFMWRDGVMKSLDQGNLSYATGINASGQIVGGTEVGGGFLWQNYHVTQLGLSANAINDLGHVVGANGAFTAPQAYFWQHGVFTELGPGTAYAINNKDQVAGKSSLTSHATLWQNGTALDLGTLGGRSTSSASGINAQGDIVGYSALRGQLSPEAFLWKNGAMLDLGPGGANAINASGIIVGETDIRDNAGKALLWENGTMHDLNDLIPADSGWLLVDATALNDLGQIVGIGIHDGKREAFLLTPNVAPVPETGSLCLLSIGVLGLLAWRFARPICN